MVGVQVAELRYLLKRNTAAIPPGADGEMVMREQPGGLPRQAIVILLVERVRDQPRARLAGLVLFESLGDAAQIGKRLSRGIACSWETAVAVRVQRADIRRGKSVERLVKRFVVDVAIDRVRPNVAEIGASGKREVIPD